MKKIMSKVSGIFIPVTDMRRSTDWYKRVFGMEVIQESDICTGLRFPDESTIVSLFRVKSAQTTQFEGIGGDKIPYYNFESFDIEYSHASLKEKGVEVLPIIDDGDIRFFDFTDPDGNIMGIVEELPGSVFYPHKQKYRKE